jgi:hypothetical protein
MPLEPEIPDNDNPIPQLTDVSLSFKIGEFHLSNFSRWEKVSEF